MALPNNPPPPPSQAELLDKWEQSWRQAETEMKVPFTRKEFTFTASEVRQLLQQATMQTFASKISDFAEAAINDMVNIHILPRVGVIPNEKLRFLYDLATGRFMIWTPKEQKKDSKSPEVSEKVA